MRYRNIQSLFAERVDRFRTKPDRPARDVFYYRRDERWVGISWDVFAEETTDFATALLSLGLTQNASVCILMGNVPQWPVVDIGTITAGGVGVGLYPTSSAEQCEHIINHSDAEFVIVDSREQLQKGTSVRGRLSKLRRVIVLDEICDSPENISYSGFLQRGRRDRERFAEELRLRAARETRADVAIMVYTSGTTGSAKGARLTHRYIINSVESLRQ